MHGPGILLLCAGVFLLTDTAAAQNAASGAIAGVARDTTGLVMPGVTVEAASPALIEKVRSVVTDESGQYRIVDLRSGTYTVTFTLPGFTTFKREGIELVTNFTAAVNAEMKIGDLEETIIVSGATPVVDIQNVRTQAVLGRQVLDTIPGAKNFAGMAKLTVGATGGTNDVGGNNGEGSLGTIHGTGSGTTTVDGQKIMSVFAAGTGVRASMNTLNIQEVVLDTSGAFAESESGGLNVNIVSRDGGNSFRGLGTAIYSTRGLQSSNLSDDLIAAGLTTSAKIRRIYDYGIGIGGPIRKDRLWFFAAYREWGAQQDVPGYYFNALQTSVPAGDLLYYSPDLSRPAYTDHWNQVPNVRLTSQLGAKQRLTFSAAAYDVCQCYFLSVGNAEPEAQYRRGFWPSYTMQGTWNMPVSNRLLLDGGWNLKGETAVKDPPPETMGARPMQELSSGTRWGSTFVGPLTGLLTGNSTWLSDLGTSPNSGSVDGRFSVSYITGTHAFKTGFQANHSNSPTGGNPLFPVMYQMRNLVPVQGTFSCVAPNCVPAALMQLASPNFAVSTLRINLGVFVQDQWTLKRLTLNLGLRMDHLDAYNPPQTRPAGEFLPEISFPEVKDVPNWYDLGPRLGAAYDLFGNGKTAIKGSIGRYVVYDSLNLASLASPSNSIGVSTTRTWTDSNNNLIPDCDLKSPLLNGECGAMSNRTFGTTATVTQLADDMRKGFNVRPYNWQGSVALQHELRSGFGLTVGYFHTSYGNLTIGDNRGNGPADYDPFCITTPVDSRLPGGGGQQLCGLYSIKNSAFGVTDNVLQRASDFGDIVQTYNGVDVVASARLREGGFLSGGFSKGSTLTDNCNALPDSPQAVFCRVTNPQLQFKLGGSYPLPWWGLTVAGAFFNVDGYTLLASYLATNAEVQGSLGRNLGNCAPAAAGCTATVTIPALIEPNTMRGPRQTQLDLRVGKVFKVARFSVKPNIDIFNVFNASNVLAARTAYSGTWNEPTSIVSGRLVQFSLQTEF